MKPVFSVIIPCYNEEEVLQATYSRLDAAMRSLSAPYELIFINDGSRDRTGGMLAALAREHAEVRALHFTRNFGHQIAVTAGLDAATGDAIVIIDADLQDPPEVIPEMAAKWREGYDVVYGKRARREGESAFKKLTAWGFYRVLKGMVGFPIPADAGDFRLISRRAADAVRAMPEHNRFLRGMFAWVGFRQTEVLFQRDRRLAGETKYPLRKMVKLALDGILSFSLKPLSWITGLGVVLTGIGTLWLLVLLILWVAGRGGGGNAALAGLSLLLAGLLILCLGIVGAYLARVYDEVKRRPLYLIAERHGYGEADEPRVNSEHSSEI
ncbi:MAG: glycosyltransferase family 2 protein [Firmicutes bacterium]|nr:glycosyltransferase family 2 protein [Bacillota bacterium]